MYYNHLIIFDIRGGGFRGHVQFTGVIVGVIEYDCVQYSAKWSHLTPPGNRHYKITGKQTKSVHRQFSTSGKTVRIKATKSILFYGQLFIQQ